MKYKQVRVLALADLEVATREGNPIGLVRNIMPFEIPKGWELIEIITHTSIKNDSTAIAMVLGKK